ncbi:probable magnesium transporter NIPA6 [Arachis hypogaea]|uniref:probable magnesium transporter NIPA6 n=1 Tax=Arachis hypogaea TaxID=3818 RepID=UPI0010FC511B|nr:probable magnesium transporter NIPA6 [Arachis hypogaea]
MGMLGCLMCIVDSTVIVLHTPQEKSLISVQEIWLFNQASDTFNTAVLSPIYYALFTSFRILASAIMFKDYSGQSISSIVSELYGFITVLFGTVVLHSTRESDPPVSTDLYSPLSPKVTWYIQGNGESSKQKEEDGSPFFNLFMVVWQDHFT